MPLETNKERSDERLVRQDDQLCAISQDGGQKQDGRIRQFNALRIPQYTGVTFYGYPDFKSPPTAGSPL